MLSYGLLTENEAKHLGSELTIPNMRFFATLRMT
jgi:hypothetical protein